MKLHPQVTRSLVELVKRFEGFRRQAARLPDGGWTVGYGHTLTAREGTVVTPENAELLLYYDLSEIATRVDAWTFTPLNQNQFEALVSFAYNIGLENFRQSTVLKRINEGQHLQAAAAMELWRKTEVGGEGLVADALVRRRATEKALYLTPPEGFPPSPSQVLKPLYDQSVVEAAAQVHMARRLAAAEALRASVAAEAPPEPATEPAAEPTPEPPPMAAAQDAAGAAPAQDHPAPAGEAASAIAAAPTAPETAPAAPVRAILSPPPGLGPPPRPTSSPEASPESSPESSPEPSPQPAPRPRPRMLNAPVLDYASQRGAASPPLAEPVRAPPRVPTPVNDEPQQAVLFPGTSIPNPPPLRVFEPAPRRAFADAPPAPPAANESPAAPASGPAPYANPDPGAGEPLTVADFSLFDQPLAPPESRQPAVTAARGAPATRGARRRASFGALRPRFGGAVMQDRNVLVASVGLLGVALFTLALFTMLVRRATTWHLLIGFVGVGLMTLALIYYLMQRAAELPPAKPAAAEASLPEPGPDTVAEVPAEPSGPHA